MRPGDLQALQEATIALMHAEPGSDEEARRALALDQIAGGIWVRARATAVIVRTAHLQGHIDGARAASPTIRRALAAADMLLTALCEGSVPSCFTPKNEAVALGLNAALQVMHLFGRSRVRFGPGSALVELRDLVKAAIAELEPGGKDVPS